MGAGAIAVGDILKKLDLAAAGSVGCGLKGTPAFAADLLKRPFAGTFEAMLALKAGLDMGAVGVVFVANGTVDLLDTGTDLGVGLDAVLEAGASLLTGGLAGLAFTTDPTIAFNVALTLETMDFLGEGAATTLAKGAGLAVVLMAAFLAGTGLAGIDFAVDLTTDFVFTGMDLLGSGLLLALTTGFTACLTFGFTTDLEAGLATGLVAGLVGVAFLANGFADLAEETGAGLDDFAGTVFGAVLTTALPTAFKGKGFLTAALALTTGFLGATFISLSPPGLHCLHTTCNTTYT